MTPRSHRQSDCQSK